MQGKTSSVSESLPTIHRCRTRGGDEISWAAAGTHRPAVLVLGGWITHAGLDWVSGPSARFLHRLAGRRRLLRFDFPGSGLSPAAAGGLTLDTAVEAAEAVIRASGETTVAVLSYGFADQVAIALAARRPDLVSHLMLMGDPAAVLGSHTEHDRLLDAALSLIRANWRLGAIAMAGILAPGASARRAAAYADHQQACASNETAETMLQGMRTHDAGQLMQDVTAPTLVLRADDAVPTQVWPATGSAPSVRREVRISVEDRVPFFGACEAVVDAVCSFTDTGQAQLTLREQAVLRELGYGHTNRKVARRLGISEHTAAKHVSNLLRKLEVSNRCAAVIRGQQLGLMSAFVDPQGSR
jgi:DNA-binding NarL/FixJ family response regulator